MSRQVLVFWGTAVGIALGFALLAALLLPFDALGIRTLEERERAWLLTVWTGGVLAILFGLSALLGAFSGMGFREVVEAGSVREAVETHRRSLTNWGAGAFHHSFAWWVISTGGLVVAIYFVGWMTLR
ncbi:MAG TPA: hypothetical protein VGR27_02450 [Longimicrobiaceae bacterium]|nr:hypothetical protein [Longimicrobiaceae bacterium]